MPSWGNAADSRYNQDMVNWRPGIDNQQARTLHVNDVNVNNDAKIALKAVNTSTNADARALKIEGIAEFLGRIAVDNAVIKIKNCTITNEDNGDAIKLQPNGNNWVLVSLGNYVLVVSGGLRVSSGETRISSLLQADADVQCDEQLRCDRLLVGKDRDGAIDTWDEDRDLLLGTDGQTTRDVKISRTGQTTKVQGDLTVEEDLLVDGGTLILNDASLESSGADDLKIGTEGNNIYVLISRAAGTTIINGIGIVKGNLALGDLNNHGRIDCNAVEANNRELQIGTQNGTCAVIIGRDGRRTIVRSDLKVGPANAAGVIESGGTQVAPQNLNIGSTAETLNIHISRPGQTVIINNTIRIQLDAALNATIIFNGDEALTIADPLARGIADNPVGHGFGSSMDHVINGVPRFCVDQTGGHNV